MSFIKKYDIDTILENLPKIKQNLLNNYENPVFDNKGRNKILEIYSKLNDLEKSALRYKKLTENNYLTEAQEEMDDMENVVLKGGISNVRYIWHSEFGEHTCDECEELDGQEFDCYDELPQQPHPNCKCYVEIVEDDDEKVSMPKAEPENKVPPQKPEQLKIEPNWDKPCNGPITSPYGNRIHPIYKTNIFHSGWDIGVPVGTPIQAIADGKVEYAGPAQGYGKMVLINHGTINGKIVTSEYGHISSYKVKSGQVIKKGDIIATSGNEGTSSGPHLHITIREGFYPGKPVDPSIYIKY